MSKGIQRGPAYAYNVQAVREQEMVIARRAETAHDRVVAQGYRAQRTRCSEA